MGVNLFSSYAALVFGDDTAPLDDDTAREAADKK